MEIKVLLVQMLQMELKVLKVHRVQMVYLDQMV